MPISTFVWAVVCYCAVTGVWQAAGCKGLNIEGPGPSPCRAAHFQKRRFARELLSVIDLLPQTVDQAPARAIETGQKTAPNMRAGPQRISCDRINHR